MLMFDYCCFFSFDECGAFHGNVYAPELLWFVECLSSFYVLLIVFHISSIIFILQFNKNNRNWCCALAKHFDNNWGDLLKELLHTICRQATHKISLLFATHFNAILWLRPGIIQLHTRKNCIGINCFAHIKVNVPTFMHLSICDFSGYFKLDVN